MIIRGRVQDGVVVLEPGASLPEGTGVVVFEKGASLPEGARVVVVYAAQSPPTQTPQAGPVQFPLVRSARPGSIDLTNDRIAEFLDEEDAAPRR